MSLSSDEYLLMQLNDISIEINRYLSIFIFLFGVIGNILNILVLSQRTLRSNSCAWLFLISSISNLIAILSEITTRMLSSWTIDPTDALDWLCKLHGFLTFNARTIAYWLITLATIDRWFLSSLNVNTRQWSTSRNAQRSTIIILILSSLLYVDIFYCYESNLLNAPLPCYSKNTFCLLIIDVSALVMSVLLPILFMIIFGVMTILNIRRSKCRVRPVPAFIIGNNTIQYKIPLIGKQYTHHNTIQKKKTDGQLFKMLSIQVILLTFFTLPLILEKIYSIFIRPQKSPIETAIDTIIYKIALLLNYLTNGMPFYIYTLFGESIFRKELFHLLTLFRQKFECHRTFN
ncbi:unnamed protein product [Adineta steineri]|uniref:G-protein coupled receptors family 1 profile domain-containing protein n=1 Tax=Adineta steineri TaxID=433720 RepID=A0A819WA32_9BILA|nr:unnamed protein product [Adineta steineri]CAF4121439.1 unnamed protein product [Adineta steineri]